MSAITPGPLGTADVTVLSIEGTTKSCIHGYRVPLGTAGSLQGPVGEAEALSHHAEEAVAIPGDLPNPVLPMREVQTSVITRCGVLRFTKPLDLQRVLNLAWALANPVSKTVKLAAGRRRDEAGDLIWLARLGHGALAA